MTVVEHHSVEELQMLFQREREARSAKRLWIVWQACRGQTAPEIAQGIGMSRRAVQEWVRRYNTEGLAGLKTCAGQGREPILSEDERQALVHRLEAGPQAGDVCSLRGVDFQQFLEEQFGKLLSLSAVYGLLHELGYEWLVPRSKHRKSDPDDWLRTASRPGSVTLRLLRFVPLSWLRTASRPGSVTLDSLQTDRLTCVAAG